MDLSVDRIKGSPIIIRVLPFAVLAGLTFGQGLFGEASRYWMYAAKTVAGAWIIWLFRPWIAEMRWRISAEAVGVGVLVFVIWVGLDSYYPKIGGPGVAWNPHAHFGLDSAWAWFFVVVRLLGSSLVVPPIEEVFYRSFLYRYIADQEFEKVPFRHLSWTALLVTAGIFGLAHYEWLAGILCALLYQALVIRKDRLGDAISAHAITNFLLGIWIVWRGAWQFW
jgi:uncharacterized protein